MNNSTGVSAQHSDLNVGIYITDNLGFFLASKQAQPTYIQGSVEGTISSIILGTYLIMVTNIINGVPFSLEFSGNCIAKGPDFAEVLITEGDKVTCTVTASSANF